MHSMKCECLNRMLFSGEKSLRKALTEFNAYYHEECNHHGLDNTFVVPGKEVGGTDKKVVCRNPSTACSATTTAKPPEQLPSYVLFRKRSVSAPHVQWQEHEPSRTKAANHYRKSGQHSTFNSLRHKGLSIG